MRAEGVNKEALVKLRRLCRVEAIGKELLARYLRTRQAVDWI